MVAETQSSSVIAFSGNTMVYESIKRFALKGLNELIRVLMENVDDALFDLSEKVDNDHERTLYFESMREIRLKRKTIQANFDEELKQSFDRLIMNKSIPAQHQGSDELSLVELSEVEDRLAIDNMISKARPYFDDDLFAVVERFKVILHRKQINDDQNPLDPKAICNSFHNASQVLDTEIQAKLIFYKLFDKFVMSNLGSFYRELNDYFIQKGVLPEFKAAEERLKQTTRFMAARGSRSASRPEKADSFAVDTFSADDYRSSGGGFSGSPEGSILNLLQQLLTPQQKVSDSDVFALSTDASPYAQQSDRFSAGQVEGDIPTGHNRAYMGALTGLQSSNVLVHPALSVNPVRMKSELHKQLETFKQENAHQGSASDNQIIDVVSMLFDFFFDDETLPDPIKVLIGRLQIPILKVAILDGSFFNHKKHPARKLLDSISKAALGWGSDQAKEQLLVEEIEKIVEILLAEFDEDIAVFEQALDKFEQFIKAENEKVKLNLQKLQQQEQEKEDRIKRAHQAADRLLAKLESKSDFSFDVVDFLEGIWKNVLFTTYLAQGESSVHWNNLKKISSTLIWTLIPKHSEEEKAKLLKTLPPLLRALSKGMELVQIDTKQQNAVFQMLVLEHARIVKQTSKNIVTRVDDNTVWPEDNVAQALAGFNHAEMNEDNIDFLLTEDETGEIQMINNSDAVEREKDSVNEINQSSTGDVIRNLQDFTDCIIKGDIHIDEEIIMDSSAQAEFHQVSAAESDDYLEQAQGLEIGSWVEFMETNSSSLHAKLSWKSNVTGKYVFVNRQGHKIKDKSIYGLATELRSGRAKLIESVSVFDRAIHSFMSTIRH